MKNMNDFLTQKSGRWWRMRNLIRSRDIIGGTCCSLDIIMNIFDVFIQIVFIRWSMIA